jgi:hypothetical protein
MSVMKKVWEKIKTCDKILLYMEGGGGGGGGVNGGCEKKRSVDVGFPILPPPWNEPFSSIQTLLNLDCAI